jgi:hypothetical protein
MEREPISKSQVQLHPKTEFDRSPLSMVTAKIINTKARRKGTRNRLLAKWIVVTTTKECNKPK